MKFDHEEKQVHLNLKAKELLDVLQEEEEKNPEYENNSIENN